MDERPDPSGRLRDTRFDKHGVCSGFMCPSPTLNTATPDVRAQPAFPAAMPRPSGGPLVGREDDLAALVRALSEPDARIVTLAGPGGAGKSRLASEAARCVASDFEGRVAWIELAPITEDQ